MVPNSLEVERALGEHAELQEATYWLSSTGTRGTWAQMLSSTHLPFLHPCGLVQDRTHEENNKTALSFKNFTNDI